MLSRRVALLVVILFTAPASVQARPPYKKALADFLGPGLAPKLNDCTTCHLPDKPGAVTDPLTAADKPHNAFGERLKKLKGELRKADQPTDITARLHAVADEDSDGDGVPNLLELLTGHNPGDAADKPSDTEVADGRKKVANFLRTPNAYPWRPFDKVNRPPVPEVGKPGFAVRNPIDAFIAAEHAERGLTPRPEAPRAILLRRVYLDLTGLPPTPEEMHAFLDDSSADAYEKVVDKLLASPSYGERWGRHWMDVWRYSDWAGYGSQVRDSHPHVWHWRDWIVESLNADKGYDRMVLEMLAGDELAPEDPGTVRATGYLVRNWKLLSREKWMQDTVEHTFQGFMGVSIGCVRCHDHMYDAIVQKEYYQARAVFESYGVRTDRVPGQPDLTKDGIARVYDANLTAPTYRFVRGDDRNPDKSRAIEPGVPELLSGTFSIEEVKLPRTAFAPDRRPFVVKETLEASARELPKAEAASEKARGDANRAAGQLVIGTATPLTFGPAFFAQKHLDAAALAEYDRELARLRDQVLRLQVALEDREEQGDRSSAEWKAKATECHALQRVLAVREAQRGLLAARVAHHTTPPTGRVETAKKVTAAEAALAQAEAKAKVPESTEYTRRPLPVYPTTSTGRRLAFAKWVAHRDNPLTARVAVNHIWLRHFGQAIVPSVFDFGRNGQAPSHPALLDWLAVELMEHKWSMKHLHRVIVTSSAYRMASTPDAADLPKDPDNRYLCRMNPRRLEAEAVRDGVFYVAGKLDLTRGGPDLDQTQGLVVTRRSLYFRHAAEKEMEFLKLFDAADVTECYRRKESVLPQQALALANSELTARMSRLLARELSPKAGADDEKFTRLAWERVLARPATAEEVKLCVEFLREQTKKHQEAKYPAAPPDADGKAPASDPALRARENLVHTLYNHNDFVTVR